MNLFVLDYDLDQSAKYHVDSHVNKIILESAQVACSVLPNAPYKPTHIHHPIVKWARSYGNFLWTCQYGLALCKEFTYRRDKRHKTQDILEWCIQQKFDGPQTPFVLAMPSECKLDDPVASYRLYYNTCKRHLFKWSKREIPPWIF